MESRKQFIYQVRDKIRSEHGKDKNASFIFGLSGKWGEGKTIFLKSLEKELEKTGFKIVWINPWKFGDDKISFLRNFLKEISVVSKRNFWNRCQDFINNWDDLRELYYDTSYKSVHWGLLIILLLWMITGVISYWFLLPQAEQIFPGFSSDLKNRYALIAALFLTPFLIPLVGNILTTQKSSKSISTIDQFDRLLSKYLSNLASKKIAVFVDDLDRVTPEVARTALDNMRIFFDKPEITFVVTGDHTVLERYIGTQTLPHGDPAEKLEEGRRYLKKVFNLYWRLPVPIDSEFDAFLKKLLEDNKKETDEIFKEKADQETLLRHLKLYFDKNFRHVIRFFDTVLFTFKIIKNQHEAADEDKKKYFGQMLSKPLLVVRILMIQELCIPLFEAILQDTGVLRSLEDNVERKDSSRVDDILSKYTFTINQSIFIKKFLYEEPRFFKNKILEVYAFEPFLFLAADASFGDARGLSKEDFVSELKTGSPDQIANSIQNCGEEKIKEAAVAVVELLKNTTDSIGKSGYIRTLCLALAKIPDHLSQSHFIEALQKQDYSQIFSGAQVSNRLEISQEFWRWLDTQDRDRVKTFADKFPFVQTGDLDQLDLKTGFGHFGSRVLCRWLRDYYPSNKTLILDKMELIFPKLDKKIISEEFINLTDQLIQDLFGLADPEKERLYKLLMEFLPENKARLKENALTQIKAKNEGMWQWSETKVSDNYKPWTHEELERGITETIKESTTGDELVSGIRYANGKVTKSVNATWVNIKKGQLDLVVGIIQQLANDSLTSFIPPKEVASALFTKTVSKIESGDDSMQIALLPSLQKRWLWENISKMSEYRRIKKMLDSTNQDVIREVNLVLQSWGRKEGTSTGESNTSSQS